jgi:hypothetical protein
LIRTPGYRLTVAGPLPRAVAWSIHAQLDAVAIPTSRMNTVVDLCRADQSALRAADAAPEHQRQFLDVTSNSPSE